VRRRIPTVADPPPASANLAAVVKNSNIVLSWAGPDDAGITGHRNLRPRPTEDEDTLLVYVTDTGNIPATHTDTNAQAGVGSVCRVEAISSARLSPRSNFTRAMP
jgi:hypothetical protein